MNSFRRLCAIHHSQGLVVRIKRIVVLVCMPFVAMFSIVSCQNQERKSPTDLLPTNDSDSSIDSSCWLKNTTGIRDILEDSKGNVWFSSPDFVAMFDGEDMHYYSEDEGLSSFVNLHEDSEGTIWVEDGFSIFRFDGSRFIKEKLSTSSVSGSLWIQRGLSPTESSYTAPGVYKLDGKSPNFIPFPIKEDINNKYLYYPTTKGSGGKDSTIWFGTMEKVFGLKNNNFITIGREELGRENDNTQMGIRGIFVDDSGKLWLADNGAGVFVYDGNETENFTSKFRLNESDVEGSTLHRAFSISQDSEGDMWFGTVYSGIWRFNPKTEKFKNFASDKGVKSETIWTIYKTRKGELLFGGESPGAVYMFNGKLFERKF